MTSGAGSGGNLRQHPHFLAVGGIAPVWSATLPLTKIMEGRTAIQRGSSFDKMNRICELDTAKAFFRQLQATLAEKRGVNAAPSGISVRRRRNRQRP